jgi:hypothetical protein
MAEPADYFIASSARHVLFDAALALAGGTGRHCRLYIAQHIRSAWIEQYVAAFGAWPGSPFRSVGVLEADWRPRLAALPAWRRRLTKPLVKRGFLRRNRQRLEQDLRAHPPRALYVSCDTFYESQYALHLARRIAPDARRIYVEDGTSAYTHSFTGRRLTDWPKEFARRFRYGSWWRPCTLPGASGWLDEGYVLYPELAIRGLRHLRLHRLDPALLLAPGMVEFAAVLARRFGLDVAALRGADAIVTIANSRWSHRYPRYREVMAGICRALLEQGQSVVLKQHPADLQQGDPLGLGERPGLYVAPSALPVEVMLMLLERPDATLLGDASTCMMSARWLRPDVRAIALRLTPDGADIGMLGPVFERIGVVVESRPERVPAEYFAAGRA